MGFPLAKFEEELIGRITETGLRTSLALLTAIEAHLRDDFQVRMHGDYNDILSRSFRELQQAHGTRVRLDDLLDLWRRHHPYLQGLVSQLRAASHYRNWLAHGRYGERPKNDKFDYASSYDLAEATMLNFPLMSGQSDRSAPL